VNALDTPWCRADVVGLVERAAPAIGSLVLPKVGGAEDVLSLDSLLGTLGDAAGAIGIQALVETARGLRRAGEIAAASPRVQSLILGYADLAASLGRGADLPPERWLYAQETVLVAARDAGIEAIDGPYLAIRDEPGLRAWADHVRALGFDGKWAVHPGQIAHINEAFTPRRGEFERACAIVATLERAEEGKGRGALELEGEMIDEASRKLALQVVARGRAAGLTAPGEPLDRAAAR
jgi:citrate lyase subunit beta/citryl-CoA lyase